MTDFDRTDIGILRILQNDARHSIKQIGNVVGLSASTVHTRIGRMRELGVIRGLHAEVNAKALGVGLEAIFMVGLEKHERGVVDALLDELEAVPEVRSAFLISGQHDLVVHVMVRDTQHLKDLAFDRLTSRPGVSRVETSIVFDGRHRHEVPVYFDAVEKQSSA